VQFFRNLKISGLIFWLVCSLALGVFPAVSSAQDASQTQTQSTTQSTKQSQTKGDASLRIEYQYLHTGSFFDDLYEFDYSNTDTHAAVLSADYAVSDRWSIFAAIPYVKKRHQGGDPHNPNDAFWVDFVPPDKRFIDDGSFHGGLQDLTLGVRYLALDADRWTISPYIAYGVPTNNYPFYAKAAIGANLWNVPVGAQLTFTPYFSDWYFGGNAAYVFSEKPLGVNVDYWLVYASAGYYFKPNFAMNVFLSGKYVIDGLKMPWDFTDDPTYANYPEAFDTERWWNHDRLLGHRFLNLGVGFDYYFNANYQVSGSFFTGIWAEQTNELDYAFTLSLTRYWGGGDGG
jgi:hypothetical protein